MPGSTVSGDARACQRSATRKIPVIMITSGQESDRVGSAGRRRLPLSSPFRRIGSCRRHKPRSLADHGPTPGLRRLRSSVRSCWCARRPARSAVQGQSETAPAGAEWVGIAFRLGGEGFLLAREETREVMAYPTVVTRVPGAKLWIRGLSNVRGQLLPIVDLRAFLGSGTTNVTRATRVLIANHREISRVSSPTRPGFRGLPRASLQPSCRRR